MFPHLTKALLAMMLMLVGCAPESTVTPVPEPASVAAVPATSTTSPSPVPPTATSTLEPAPEFFREEFDAAAPHWTFSQAGARDEAFDAVPVDGTLQLTLSAGNLWAYAIYEPHVYSDVRVDALVDLGVAGDGSAGLICRFSRENGWYEFNIDADGTYALLFGQWLADGIARYTPLAVAEAEVNTDGPNEIGLACVGDVLTAYINGRQVRSRRENQHVLTDGSVGLSGAAFETAPLTLSYGWVSVSSP